VKIFGAPRECFPVHGEKIAIFRQKKLWVVKISIQTRKVLIFWQIFRQHFLGDSNCKLHSHDATGEGQWTIGHVPLSLVNLRPLVWYLPGQNWYDASEIRTLSGPPNVISICVRLHCRPVVWAEQCSWSGLQAPAYTASHWQNVHLLAKMLTQNTPHLSTAKVGEHRLNEILIKWTRSVFISVRKQHGLQCSNAALIGKLKAINSKCVKLVIHHIFHQNTLTLAEIQC